MASVLMVVWGLAGGTIVAGQAGTITGTVTTPERTPPAIRVTFDQRVCGADLPDHSILTGTAGRLANAVVTLVGVKAPARPRQVDVLNDKCAFVPRVQVVAPGASVKTSSRDPVLHTTVVQRADGRQLFNVALPVPGIEITKPLVDAGVLRVGCSTHQWMRGWVIVTDELSAVTGPDGRFTLAGVAPGTYQLRIWHESLKAAAQTVTVAAGRSTDVRFEMR